MYRIRLLFVMLNKSFNVRIIYYMVRFILIIIMDSVICILIRTFKCRFYRFMMDSIELSTKKKGNPTSLAYNTLHFIYCVLCKKQINK